MTGHVLDLTNYHFCRRLGDLTVYGTWLGDAIDDSEPCIVIVPTFRLGVGRSKPAVVALSSAYKYDSPVYLLHMAHDFADGLGFGAGPHNTRKVAEVIHSHLRDLIDMPPRPVIKTEHVAEAILTHESGRKKTFDVTEDS